jgi:hypothetical protein
VGGSDDTAGQSTGTERTAAPDTGDPLVGDADPGVPQAIPPPEIGGDTVLLYTKTAKLSRDKADRELRLYGRKGGDGYYEEMLLWIGDAASGRGLPSLRARM